MFPMFMLLLFLDKINKGNGIESWMFISPSYTQSGTPLRIRFSSPLKVTCSGADPGLVFTYTLLPQT